MLGFLCSLWPWLLGGLLGWLLCGLLARRMLRGPDLRGRLAEKDGHIQRLTGEMATLQARPPVQVEKIVEKIVEKPVDRVVEKFIDRPVDRVVEKLVDRPVDRVVEKIVEKYVDRPVDRIVEKIVDRPVERIVEKLVDRPVDSPALLARVAALTAEVAVVAGLRHRIQQFESTPPKVVEKIVEKPVDRIVEKIVEKPVDRIVEKIVEKPVDRIVEKIVEKPVDRIVDKLVDNPAHLARIAALTAEVAVIAGMRSRIQQLESTPPKVVEKIVEKPVDRIVEKIVEKPVDRIVEKIVEKPVDRIVEKIVEKPVDRIVEKIVEKPVDRIVEKIVEKPVDRIVEKIVEKPVDRIVEKIVEKPVDRIVEKIVEKPVDRIVDKLVDNPAHLARIAALTAEVAVIAGMRSRIQQLESTPPKVVEKIVEKPVDRIVEKIVEKPVDRIVEKIVEKPVDRIVEKIVEKPVDRIVDKLVDNPAHLARIAALTAEVAVIAGMRSRIQQLESTPPKVVEKIVEKPVDRIVEKIVEKPVDRIVEKIVEKPVDRIVEKIVEKPVDRIVEKIVDRPVDRIVEKTVEKLVDNPVHLARIAALTAEVAVVAGLRSRVQQLESTPPKVIEKIVDRPVDRVVEKVVEKIVDRPVDRIVEKIVEKPVDRIVEKTVEKLVPDTAGLAERDRQLADWRQRYGELERRFSEGPALDLAAAKAAGYSVKGADDLEIIEGIGPKIAQLLRNAGIRTFAQLADTPTAQIQSVLDAGGGQFRIANPGTWAEQSDLAARNRWTSLKALQDTLVAGVRVAGGGVKPAPERSAGQADVEARLSALQLQLAEREAELQRLRQPPPLDKDAARAAGFKLKGEDDLEVIEGIGPKIAALLRHAGVHRFVELAAMTPAQIQPILDQAGPAFKLAKPDTWPEQADLAARNRWQDLKALQDALNAGNRS